MRVITLTPDKFTGHCHRLETLSQGFHPDLIVTIATGGDFVGAEMFKAIPHVSVRLQRPSTAKKRGLMMNLIRHLPRFLKDRLRIAESIYLSRKRSSSMESSTISKEESANLITESVKDAVADAQRILIVDDAVDSGVTLSKVVEALKGIRAEADSNSQHDEADRSRKIATAVITVTTGNPVIQPTYTLYNDRTLIRFPWSADN